MPSALGRHICSVYLVTLVYEGGIYRKQVVLTEGHGALATERALLYTRDEWEAELGAPLPEVLCSTVECRGKATYM